MFHTPLKSASLLTLSLLAATAQAQTVCYSAGSACSNINIMWGVRNIYCNQGLWENTGCTTISGVTITNSSPGENSEQDCWNAYYDVVTQCYENGYAQGASNVNGVEYWMDSCASSC